MILITATGRDMPGMVAAISQTILDANCNIEDATMTRLSGEFAMILVIANPADLSTPELENCLAPLRESHGLRIHCNPLDDVKTIDSENAWPRFVLSAYGPDRTGLVARVSGVLASHGANVTDLQTRVASGHSLYVMIFELEIPPTTNLANLQSALDDAAQELNVELSLRALEEDTL